MIDSLRELLAIFATLSVIGIVGLIIGLAIVYHAPISSGTCAKCGRFVAAPCDGNPAAPFDGHCAGFIGEEYY